MRTIIKSFYFDVSIASQAADYAALCESMAKQGTECFETHGGKGHHFDWCKDWLEIELDTNHVFNNQWNTGPIDGVSEQGYRVFDWAMDACLPNKNIKRGHYLSLTLEMIEVRDNTMCCGYCGKQEPAQKGLVFCDKCCVSEYLDDDQIHLLRMLPASSTASRGPITQAERDNLLPAIMEAREAAQKERHAKKRLSVIADCEKSEGKAQTTRDGLLWLLDNGLDTDNWIYYDHTGRWAFGWRNPVREVPAKVCEFPFDFDIKRAG
jgi:hypothetical protein